MANNTRRRLSFVDLDHPQVWNKLLEYTQVTLALTELSLLKRKFKFHFTAFFFHLVTDFTDQWAKICILASAQLQQLVNNFRKKTEVEILGK
jgi:hypothetical protein